MVAAGALPTERIAVARLQQAQRGAPSAAFWQHSSLLFQRTGSDSWVPSAVGGHTSARLTIRAGRLASLLPYRFCHVNTRVVYFTFAVVVAVQYTLVKPMTGAVSRTFIPSVLT